jgi:hypothetical protein
MPEFRYKTWFSKVAGVVTYTFWRGSIPDKCRDFSLRRRMQTSSWAHQASVHWVLEPISLEVMRPGREFYSLLCVTGERHDAVFYYGNIYSLVVSDEISRTSFPYFLVRTSYPVTIKHALWDFCCSMWSNFQISNIKLLVEKAVNHSSALVLLLALVSRRNVIVRFYQWFLATMRGEYSVNYQVSSNKRPGDWCSVKELSRIDSWSSEIFNGYKL